MARAVGQTRQRMLASAVALLSRTGTAGTTVDAVLADSGAPRGSVYHHFPGGRSEIVLDAVRLAADSIEGLIERAARDGAAPAEVLAAFAALWRRRLLDSDYQAGCPVLALAVAGPAEAEPARDLVAAALTGWQRGFADLLVARDTSPDRARRLAALVVSSVEGAVVLCRAQRSTQPLDDVVTEVSALL